MVSSSASRNSYGSTDEHTRVLRIGARMYEQYAARCHVSQGLAVATRHLCGDRASLGPRFSGGLPKTKVPQASHTPSRADMRRRPTMATSPQQRRYAVTQTHSARASRGRHSEILNACDVPTLYAPGFSGFQSSQIGTPLSSRNTIVLFPKMTWRATTSSAESVTFAPVISTVSPTLIQQSISFK